MSMGRDDCKPSPAHQSALSPIDHGVSERTGIPMVLNTSFNENEPVVCKPEEALDCFLRTQMDVLVLGNVMISRGKIVDKISITGATGFVTP